MKYQFTDSSNDVVAIIEDDGSSRTSFIVNAEGSYQSQYQLWLADGNTPNPYVPPAPPTPLTPAEKLAAAGLSVDELKSLLGL